MPIRPATPKDEQAIVSICTASWFDEALFGYVMHPNRHRYPDDVSIFWHEGIRGKWRNPRNRLIVAVSIEENKEKIVGVALWQRQGNDEGAKHVEREWVDIGPNAFPPLTSTHNRALDPSKRTILEDSFPHFLHHWEGGRSTNWYLNLCGVHPEYQGRGFGRELVNWGLDLARAENVHASVTASLGNEAFYLRCGFDDIVGNCTEGHGNPMKGIEGGDILFMWPKDQDQDQLGSDCQATP